MTELVLATYATATVELPGAAPFDLPAPKTTASVEEMAFFVGIEGASAYQLAVAGGFVGNEAAWLASLVGPQGIQGPAGPAGADGAPGAGGAAGAQGPQGIQGPTGPAGADGAPGAAGAAGAAGAQGPQGIQGPSGAAGAQGPQGIQGPIGSAGADGADGSPGAAGADGAPGAAGAQGPQGIQGPAGPAGPQGPIGPAGAGGGAAVSAVEIDFGPIPREQVIVTVATAGVLATNRILAWQAGAAATGRDAAENEWDQLHVVAIAETDAIRFSVTSLSGVVTGPYVLHVQIN